MMLTFEHVEKSYGAIHALDGLSFGVAGDEIVAVLGPNGAGKTTTLEIALGLRDADRGTVKLFGGSPRDVAVRRRLGATPQESGFPDTLRVREIAGFVASHYPNGENVATLLDRFGLTDLAERRAGELSGGQLRRVALALAFAGNPELAILDEPTTGLDVESRRRLWDTVRDVAAGRSVLFTTHYLEEAQAFATRVVVIDKGTAIFDGDPAELRRRFGRRRIRYVGEPLDPVALGFDASWLRENGHVIVTTADTDEYVRALVRSGAPFAQLEIVQPSLEDAFISMTGAAS
jgi:ABC-2 type transport system ATP-binding protein